MKTKSWVHGVLLLLLILLPLWMGSRKANTLYTNSVFTTITGKKIAMTALRGKPVLITFWATTCGSCVKEIPDLIALYERFHPQGLEVIAIAMPYDLPNHVVAMSKDLQLPYDVVLDITSEHTRAFGKIWATPTTLLIGKDGAIAKREVGTFEMTDMQNRIEHLLNPSPPMGEGIIKG
jgi:thiol-disulfide isomerase/thioredoxin